MVWFSMSLTRFIAFNHYLLLNIQIYETCPTCHSTSLMSKGYLDVANKTDMAVGLKENHFDSRIFCKALSSHFPRKKSSLPFSNNMKYHQLQSICPHVPCMFTLINHKH